MKIIAILLFFVSLNSVSPDDPKYIEAMTKNIKAVYEARSVGEFQQSVNAFERIAAAEKNKWEPHYYAAFGYIMMANADQATEKKDQYLDQALAAIKKADAIRKDDAEILSLEGFAHMIRAAVDPASRGPQYSGMAMQVFYKALAIDAENPRALALLAQMQFGTAQFLGQSTQEACSSNRKALEMFGKSEAKDPIAPAWGQAMAESLLERCK